MNLHDEELQGKIEAGFMHDNHAEAGDDAVAYKHVFSALSKPPESYLPANFADKIVLKATRKQKSRLFVNDYLWLAAGISAFLIAFGVTIFLTGFKFDFGFLKHMAGYKGLFFFGVLFITFLHWIDKRVIRAR